MLMAEFNLSDDVNRKGRKGFAKKRKALSSLRTLRNLAVKFL
jgi:hypothetical protein